MVRGHSELELERSMGMHVYVSLKCTAPSTKTGQRQGC